MTIWDDPVINELISYLKRHIRKRAASSKKDTGLTAPRFVFVCGKAKSSDKERTIRDFIIENFTKYKIKNEYGKDCNAVLCMKSEELYVQDLANDILTFETMLAEISQRIIIVTESAGTYCELGAFVMDKDCRNKAVVLNEDREDYKKSFITDGPIKLLESQDENSVILHNGLERLHLSYEFNCRMEEIAAEELYLMPNTEFKNINLKSLIYELANIIEIFQPLEASEIQMLYINIMSIQGSYVIANKAGHKIDTIKKVVNLMRKMELVTKNNGYYFLNPDVSCYNVLFNISRRDFNNIRIQYLSRLNKIEPQGRMATGRMAI